MKKALIMAGAALMVAASNASAVMAATDAEITSAITKVETAIAEVGSAADTLVDGSGVSIRKHVNYLERQIALAQMYLNGCLEGADTDTIYASLNDGADGLVYLVNTAKARANNAANVASTTNAASTASVASTANATNTASVATTAATASEASNNTASNAISTVSAATLATTNTAVANASAAEQIVPGVPEASSVDTAKAEEIAVPATGNAEIDWEETRGFALAMGITVLVGLLGIAGIMAMVRSLYAKN